MKNEHPAFFPLGLGRVKFAKLQRALQWRVVTVYHFPDSDGLTCWLCLELNSLNDWQLW